MPQANRRDFLLTAATAACASSLTAAIAATQPDRTKIKVGQIGVGHAHANKISVFRNSPDYEVVGVVESDPELRAAAEKQAAFQGLPWIGQEELLNTPDVQLVLVETRVPQLLDAAQACIASGKHIHLDKPAGRSLPQFRRILKEASQKKLLVQMGYMYRYNPGVVMLRDFLRKGWLGQPFEVHAVMSKVVPAPDRRRLVASGESMMFELGCHLIDLMVSILGKPLNVSPFSQHVSPLADSLIDNTLAVFTYPHALASLTSSALEVDGGERRHFVVCGTEGTFHLQPLDNPSARITLSTAREGFRRGYQEIALPGYTRYVDDAADIARILRGEKVSDFSYQHDLDVQETVLRACGWDTEK